MIPVMRQGISIAKVLETFPSMLNSHIAIVAQRSTLFIAEILAIHVREGKNIKIKVFVDFKAAETYCMENLGS